MANLFTLRNIIVGLVVIILAVSIPVTLRLAQQQTQLKSKAAQPTFGSITVGKSSISKVGGNWESIPVTVTISVPGADNSKTVAGVYITKTENVSSGVGWTAVGKFYGSNGTDSFSWTPSGNFGAGSYTFGLFHMDQNTVLDIIQTSSPVEFRASTTATPTPIPGGGPQACTPNQIYGAPECRKCSSTGTFPDAKGSYFPGTEGSTEWCACSALYNDPAFYQQKCGTSSGPTPTPAAGGPQACTPNQIVGAPECRKCNSTGTGFPDAKGSYFPGTEGSTEWCACSKLYNDPAFYQQKCGTTGGTGTDIAECKSVVFKQNNQTVSTSLKVGQKYDVEITMENKDYNNPSFTGSTWTAGNLSAGTGYFLGFPTAGDSGAGDFKVNTDTPGTDLSINSLWQVNWTDPTKLRIPLGTSVPPNGSYPFKFTVTPQKAGTHTFFWGMVHEGVSWFGGQCTSNVTVDGTVCPTYPQAGTTKTCGSNTYDSCVDDKGQKNTGTDAANFCKGEAQKFRCYYSQNPNVCISGSSPTDFNYSCSACPLATSTPLPGQEGTLCYIMTENPLVRDALNDCDDAQDNFEPGKPVKYSTDPTKISYTFEDNKTAGVKTIFVRFISNNGAKIDRQKSINYQPNPALTNILCTYSSTREGTIVAITGTNLGTHTQQGPGGLFVRGQKQTTTWTAGQTIITVQIPQRLEGEIPLVLRNDNRDEASGSCTVGLSTISFTTNIQCRKPGNFSAEDVNVRIYENLQVPAGTIPLPIISQKINLDSDGVPIDFNPKLEANKIYIMIIKPPQGIARRVVFTALPGTTIIPFPILIPVGDIYPVSLPDGKINALDNSQMIREWCLTKDCERISDLNIDLRVNSVDYSCLLLNARPGTNEDEVYRYFTVQRPAASATPAPTSQPAVSATVEPTAEPTPTPTPAGSGSDSSGGEE